MKRVVLAMFFATVRVAMLVGAAVGLLAWVWLCAAFGTFVCSGTTITECSLTIGIGTSVLVPLFLVCFILEYDVLKEKP